MATFLGVVLCHNQNMGRGVHVTHHAAARFAERAAVCSPSHSKAILSAAEFGALKIGKGKPGPGRPKGVPNKATTAIKEMVVQALNNSG